MAILVYYVQATDGEVGFVFAEGSKRTLYTYSSSDLTDWRSNEPGKIVKKDSIDLDYWTSTTQVLSTTSYSLMKYDTHIVTWSEKAGNYSLFEKLGATQKSFAIETLSFFDRLGDKSTSLGKLSIVCYYLDWLERVRMSPAHMLEVDRQYSMLRCLTYSDDQMRNMIAETDKYYISGDQLSSVKIRRELEYLTIEESIVPAAIVIQPTVGSDYSPYCHDRPVVPPPTDNSGLLIVVFLFTILLVLLVIVVLILQNNTERELIGANPIESIPSVIPL